MANRKGAWHKGMIRQENEQLMMTGVIDYYEYLDNNYMITKESLFPELMGYMKAKDWDRFIDLALCRYEIMPEAFAFYDRIPDALKYDFAISAYTHHGDSIPGVRKAVRGALKYGKPTLPDELITAKEIIVYRAGEEPINKAKYRISWTTDKAVADFFLKRYCKKHAKYLYKGKINPEKIIAYVDDREEREIMQYRNVYDVELIEKICKRG